MTTKQQRENAQQIRLALLAAMQDVGSPDDIIKVDYLSAGDNVPATEVNLTGICDGQGWNMHKRIDPYLKMRMAQ